MLDPQQPLSLSFLPDASSSAASGDTATVFPVGPTGLALHQDFGGDFSPSAIADFFSQGAGGNTKGGPGGGGGGGGGGGKPTPYTASNATSGITFVVDWDSSVANAPAPFMSSVETAVQYFLDNMSGASVNGAGQPLTITLNVGWGEVAGSRLSAFSLGESSTYIDPVDYTTNLKTSSLGSYLPTSDPITDTHTYWASTAEEKALGIKPNDTAVDGSVGFSSRVNWNYNSTTGSGQYDLVSVAEHEISEVMGRIGLGGSTVANSPNSYSTLDLLRYSAPGQVSPSGSSTAYFSFDNGQTSGATNLAGSDKTYFNTTAGGDIGDWASSAGNDAYNAFASSGTNYAPSTVDRLALDVLGYGSTTLA